MSNESKTILVIDDEPDVRRFVGAVLLSEGYAVLEAEDGLAGYELLQRHSDGIELVITDVQMPRMDGLTLGSKVRTEYPNVPVLYISGFIWNLPDEGIPPHRFLAKPFKTEALLRSVRRLCVSTPSVSMPL